MLKKCERIFKAAVVLSSMITFSGIDAANFSVDNQDSQGVGSMAQGILSSNAIYPGLALSNQIYFRSNLIFSDQLPSLRQETTFTILDPYQVKFETPLYSSAKVRKSGEGELIITAPWTLEKDWEIQEGHVYLNAPVNSLGECQISGLLQCQDPSYIQASQITLKNDGTLQVESSHHFTIPLHVANRGILDIQSGTAEWVDISGNGKLFKIGAGTLLDAPKGRYGGTYALQEGSLNLRNGFFSGAVELESGSLIIQTEKPFQNYTLSLMQGSVFIDTAAVLFHKPLELRASQSKWHLQGNACFIQEGVTGSGSLEFMGPGQLSFQKELPLAAYLQFKNLVLNNSYFAKNSSYTLDEVSLYVDKEVIIDATTALTVEGYCDLFYGAHSVNLEGPIKGSGVICAVGTGPINYHPTIKFEGLWSQRGGLLNFNGQIASLKITAGSELRAQGVVNALNMEGLWTLPMNAANTIPPLVAIEANVSGQMVLRPEGGTYLPGLYPLLKGEVLEVNPKEFLTPAQFEGTLVKEAQQVSYRLDKFHSLDAYLPSDLPDDKVVATVLDQFFAPAGSDMDGVIRELLHLKEDADSYGQAFQGLQPAYFSALGLVQESNFILARSALSNRMEELLMFPCAEEYVYDKAFALWIDPVLDLTEQKSIQGDMGYHGTTYGAFIGFDGKIHPKFRFGVTAGYTYSGVNWMEKVGKGFINSAYFASYFLYKPSKFYLNGSLCGGYSHYNVNRQIDINNLHRIAKHAHHGFGYSADLEIGVVLPGSTSFQPFLRQSYIGLNQEKFSETGAGSLNLNVAAKQFSMYRVEGGFIFNQCINFDNWVLSPEFSLSGIYEQELRSGNFRAVYQETEIGYEVVGMKPKRLLFAPGIALDSLFKKYPLLMGLRYHAELGSNFYDQRVSGHLEYSF